MNTRRDDEALSDFFAALKLKTPSIEIPYFPSLGMNLDASLLLALPEIPQVTEEVLHPASYDYAEIEKLRTELIFSQDELGLYKQNKMAKVAVPSCHFNSLFHQLPQTESNSNLENDFPQNKF